MGKKLKIILILLLLTLIIYTILGFLNMVPFPFLNQSDVYPNSKTLSLSINDMTKDMDLDDNTNQMMRRVTMNLYGVNGVTASEVHDWYKTRLAGNGWMLLGQNSRTGILWNAYWSGWRKGMMGFFVATFDGIAVVERTGYDTAIVTGIAPIWAFS